MKLSQCCILSLLCPILLFAQEQRPSTDFFLSNQPDDIDSLEQHYKKGIHFALQDAHKDSAAMLWHAFGIDCFRKKDYEKAIETTSNAIAIRKTLKDTFGLSRSLFNTGIFYQRLDKMEYAISYYRQVIALGAETANDKFPDACFETGKYMNNIGDFQQASLHLNLGNQFLEKRSERTPKEKKKLARLLLETGNNYNSLKKYQLAIASFKASINLFDELELYDSKYRCINGLGAAYEDLKDWSKAIDAYQVALQYFEKGGKQIEVIAVMNNLAGVLTRTGNFKKAESHLNQALQKANELYGQPPHIEKASMYDNLGDLLMRQKEYTRALSYYQKALHQVIPGFKEANANPAAALFESIYRKYELLICLGDKARCQYAIAKNNNDKAMAAKALETYYLADAVIDLLQQEQDVRAARLFWQKEAHELYEAALNTCLLLDQPEAALYFMEKSKAALLLDALLAADARKLIPDSIAQQEQGLTKAISQMEAALEDNPGNNTMRNELIALQSQRRQLSSRLAENFPRYYNIRYGQKPVSAVVLQQICQQQEQAIIQYFYGDESIYTLIAQPNQALKLLQLPTKIPVVDTAITNFLHFFQSASAIANQPEKYAQSAFHLQQMLLHTITPHLNVNTNKLCLVLDGPLHYLPFEALLEELPDRIRLGSLPYLIHQYAIGYAYSVTTLAKQLNSPYEPSIKKGEILVLAPFTVSGNAQFSALQSSTQEFDQLQSSYRGQFLKDEKATIAAFLQEAYHYPSIHLSTHAYTGQETPPAIAFRDSILSLPLLYSLQTKAQLVLLSACQTNTGGLLEGEGVMSLASGFAYTGAQSLISSLWNANDFTTADIFRRFYDAINQGSTKQLALQQSKLEYLNRTDINDALKSPYYWGGFVFIGGDGPLHLAKANSYWWWAGVIGILVVIGLWYRSRRNRNKR